MHPDFRMLVLANRPGFPFLGNDFFGALGTQPLVHSLLGDTTNSHQQTLCKRQGLSQGHLKANKSNTLSNSLIYT